MFSDVFLTLQSILTKLVSRTESIWVENGRNASGNLFTGTHSAAGGVAAGGDRSQAVARQSGHVTLTWRWWAGSDGRTDGAVASRCEEGGASELASSFLPVPCGERISSVRPSDLPPRRSQIGGELLRQTAC